MDGAGDQVLADTAFAAEQHSGAGGGDAHDGGEDLLHLRPGADDVVDAVAAAELFAEAGVLLAELLDFERLADDGVEVIEGEGLGEEIGGALFHRLDGGLDGREGGHDDHGQARVEALEGFEQLEPVHAGQAEIGEDELRLGCEAEGFFGGGDGDGLEAFGFEVEGEDAAELFFVLDDEHAGLHFRLHDSAVAASHGEAASECGTRRREAAVSGRRGGQADSGSQQ